MPDESQEPDESLGVEHLPQAELEATPGSGKVPTPLDDNTTFPALTQEADDSEPTAPDLLDAEELRGSKQPRSGDRDRRKETR